MKIDKAAENISTITELKRIASPYVIDYRGLNDDEIREALKKTAPQYYYQKNVESAVQDILLNADRNVRLIAPLYLKGHPSAGRWADCRQEGNPGSCAQVGAIHHRPIQRGPLEVG